MTSLAVAIIFYVTAYSQTTMNKTYQWPENIQPPVSDKKPKELIAHGDTRIDNYFWMNDYFKKGPDSARVVNYLTAENDYFTRMMAGTEALQEKLYKEMRARIKEKDESVPTFKNGYYYYTRQVEGKDYFVYARKKASLTAKEEVLLDVNQLAEGHSYFSAIGFSVSMDNKLLAYGIDTKSRREYKLFVKNIATGKIYPDVISNTEGDAVWANDNKTFFYTAKNPVTLLSEKIKRHVMGSNVTTDAVVYEEKDPTNYINVSKTKSDKYIIITSRATLSSELRYIDANDPGKTFTIFQPRIKDVLYGVDHAKDLFYIRTNKDAKNFKLMVTREKATGISNWVELVGHNPLVLIERFDLFKNYLTINERKNGLTQIHIINTKSSDAHFLAFDEPAYSASTGFNPEYDTDVIRFNYTSLTTPASVYDYNMKTKTKKLMKQQEVLGQFSANEYTTERVYAVADDGTKIPMSIVYKKGFKKDGSGPLLLYGYGSYGASMDAGFTSTRLSLLNRGFAYAIAHIRGGQEMGRYWYEDGKMMKKKNTFTDFIDCAEYLLANKYTSTKHLYASGGSAGGLLMGAIVNMRPELWNGIVAQVPFVDVINTMSDASIPLTTNEYDEWGNPGDKESYF
jgi:oligopeptidase B